jgi:hypothetical protein
MKEVTVLYHQTPLIAWYALILHAFWAITLAVDPVSRNATALNALVKVFGNFTMGVLISIVILTLIGLFWVRKRISTILLLIPQQLILFIAAEGSLMAVYRGTYADLVVRPRMFIAADQAPIILTAIFYTMAMIQVARSKYE